MKLTARSIAVVTVVTSILMVHAVRIFAGSGTGPCVRLQQDETHSTIECADGSCRGSLVIVHGQSECAGQDGGDCEMNDGPLCTVIPAKTVWRSEIPKTPECDPFGGWPPCACLVKCALDPTLQLDVPGGRFCD
jgi:hypothetical protein